MRRVWHRLHDNTRRGSRRNIAHHYDLGNAFYARWLDPSMTYSSAVFPSLDDVESGKLVGAVLPMSEKAQIQMRNSIEVIDYLLNQERVVWS